MLELSTPVRFVRRVGERVGLELAKRGVETVEDLLYHLPFRYEDRLNPAPIGSLAAGTMATVIGEVRGSALLKTRGGPLFELTLGQGLSTLKCMWFGGAYLRDKFHVGQMAAVYGKLELSRSTAGRFKMVQPQFELLPGPGATGPEAEFAMLEVGRIVPVYESLGGTTAWGAKLGSKWLRRVLWSIFTELDAALGSDNEAPSLTAPEAESLPHAICGRLRLPLRLRALREVHFPLPGTPLTELMSSSTPAHRRLIFEEFFYLELGLELKRRKMRERPGTAFATNDKVRQAIRQVLPFHPTIAQKRVLAEIVAEMKRPQPMRRLLQGDVGSGKTIVAMQAAIVAMENGFQAAMMAPTEILATQHFLSARKLLASVTSPSTGKPYRITLLTGSLDDAAKREARGRIYRGETNLVVGTHALIEDKVEFDRLGLVIVDEQHRFGVQQRFKLMKKPGADGSTPEPDVLVMTATPIPRTLALTVYGDLEASVIDELPPGRMPIVTRRTTEERAGEVWEFLRKQVTAGRQAYIVYPIIEGSRDDQPEFDFAPGEELDPPKPLTQPTSARKTLAANRRSLNPPAHAATNLPTAAAKAAKKLFAPRAKLRSATEMYDELRQGPLAGLRLGLLHGRMSADEKETSMRRFQRGDTDVLIATTVIEVGVDVPNASVMVIEHAERFGLAQMHQLRGRVGRGASRSFCILMTGGKISEPAERRLEAMVRTQNGFELAEFDLQQRGPGEFFGTRQAGMPEFRIANLIRDRAVLETARQEATRFAENKDPDISPAERDAVWSRLKHEWQRRYGLVEA